MVCGEKDSLTAFFKRQNAREALYSVRHDQRRDPEAVHERTVFEELSGPLSSIFHSGSFPYPEMKRQVAKGFITKGREKYEKKCHAAH